MKKRLLEVAFFIGLIALVAWNIGEKARQGIGVNPQIAGWFDAKAQVGLLVVVIVAAALYLVFGRSK